MLCLRANSFAKPTVFPLPQGIASLFITCLYSGSLSLYATSVCVACSQLEKLRAAILDIRQTHVTSEQDCGTETDQQEGQVQVRTSEELFGHMQKQLNGCIRHHQQIMRYVYSRHSNWRLALGDTILFCT
jgi:hypothetical protein